MLTLTKLSDETMAMRVSDDKVPAKKEEPGTSKKTKQSFKRNKKNKAEAEVLVIDQEPPTAVLI